MTIQVLDRNHEAPLWARRRRGKRAHLAGAHAEEQVARRYVERGMRLAHRRWRGSGGEIDLVLRDGAALVFVEVKSSTSHARAIESLSRAQALRILACAEEFLGGEPHGSLTEMRIDVALVDGQGRISIVENALMGI